jgi:DNA-binding transcriptional MocR family regulator
VVLVEDDAYGDLRFEGQPLPNLAALDQDGWVIRVGTFSKILAPGVRMGWAYARPEIIARLAQVKAEGSSGPFLTRVIARYCADGQGDDAIRLAFSFLPARQIEEGIARIGAAMRAMP